MSRCNGAEHAASSAMQPSANMDPEGICFTVAPGRSDAAHAYVFHLDIFIDAVLRSFATDARLLDAAERRDFRGDEPRVNAYHPVFERLGHAPDAPDVARVKVRGEAEFGTVGELDDFFVGLESQQQRDRAAGLLAEDLHVRGHAGEHSRLIKGPAERMTLAADRYLGAARGGIGDVLLDLFQRFAIDQRTLRHAGIDARSDFERAHTLGKLRRERVVDLVVHEQTVGADAGLAGVAILGDDRAFGRRIEIGVVEYDERRVAAELERYFLDRRRRLLHQHSADVGRAGERDLAHSRVRRHLAADR